ncbi:MAG: ribosomal protein S18-alanine N-acetyltransferase [Candidatus Bathyarchaeota archaeon]|jgi:ribosomal-protein-alanine acetyltransferase|nr:ribosomal protein S18-alanine N-acetyltransferase [Candidatus Bathyarchaeota archaeon]
MSIVIEDTSIKQLDDLYKIETECFKKEAFSKNHIANLLTDYNCISLVAKMDDKIVGFIIGMIHIERNALAGHILTIDVSPAYRRRGIAQRLLQKIEEIFREKGVKSCGLEVREDNVAALRLYQKLGYTRVAKLEHYYGDVHGIYLRKDLS